MTRLKTRLGNGKILVAPGIYDGLSGLVAERAGAEAVYLSGASIAYTRFGRPDVGLVSMSEVADTIAAIRDRISTPIVVDADTGFGNAINVKRTVRQFERVGASAIQLEDQTLPKRCGHLDGKTLVSVGEMVGKIKAALDARSGEDTLIIARTDAVAVDGLSAGIDRAAAYAEAGADVLFVEAPKSVEDMTEIVAGLGDGTPLMANMVEGGKTPAMTAADLEALGFALVIFPGGAVRAIAATLEGYYSSLVAHGSNEPFRKNMVDFEGINRIVGTPELLEEARRYDEEQQ
ncbi:isocitrate lyase/PEP mutase family protein [Microbaculum marinisediminis]|uniref:Isocitrate lyase/PEP mutase family protein n=1 Tax=Microbaculum marinisediminis TaxID=2931392 RepID=A0AAW5R4S0_9HYPH|nr:isocitrate lyase/PEP mutase family protein [Microbaculum sp. A6E488]MCT8973663.1 isocitrate lyase/PEP mutase family protein [Microbaculum sp. A6E488]